MSFSGYEYTYKLNISHSFDMSGEGKGKHQHTLDIKIHIKKDLHIDEQGEGTDFNTYDSIVKDIDRFFEAFSGKYINDIPPFDKVMPTIEALGEYFFERLNDEFEVDSYKIYKVEISEIPSRVYVITDFLKSGEVTKDSSLQEMNVAKYINATAKYLDFYIRFADRFQGEEKVEELPETDVVEATEEVSQNPVEDTADYVPKKVRFKNWQYVIFGACMSVLIAAVVWCLLILTGSYPLGKEVYEHLALSDYLQEQIACGNLFPDIFHNWYGGYEMFATTAPLPYYIMAVLEMIIGQNSIFVYVAYMSLLAAISCFGWFLNGISRQRYWMGMVLGAVWMFVPYNLDMILVEGRLPFAVLMALVPYFIYAIRGLIEKSRPAYIIMIAIVSFLMILSDVFPAMIAIFAVAIVTLFMGASHRKFGNSIIAIISIIAGIALTSWWLVPAYQEGLPETFINLACGGNTGVWIVMLLLALVCVFIASDRSKYAYIMTILFGLLALASRGEFVDTIPMSKYIFSNFYAVIACAGLFLGMLEWHDAKNYIMAIMAVIIIACCVPAVVTDINWYVGDDSLYEQEVEILKNNGIESAIVNADEKLFIADFKNEQIFPAYYGSVNDIKVTLGAGIDKKSPVLKPIVNNVDYALYCGQYAYVFDRVLEGRNDTVAVSKDDIMQSTLDDAIDDAIERASKQLEEGSYEDFYYDWLADDYSTIYADSEFAMSIYNEETGMIEMTDVYREIVAGKAKAIWEKDYQELTAKLCATADSYGYNILSQTDDYYIFKNSDVAGKAVVNEYKGIAIGNNSSVVSRMFPYFEEGWSVSLDSYSFDVLSQYDKVVLLGTEFDSLKEAEEKINKLIEAGTDVYIDMSDIQADQISGRRTFMGVTAQDVHFEKGYEYLIYDDEVYETTKFGITDTVLDTVYLEGLDEILGYSWLGGERIAFCGIKNKVHFFGFDILAYTSDYQDRSAEKVVTEIIDLPVSEGPERRLTGLNINYDGNELDITTDEAAVNTGLAAVQCYQGDYSVHNGYVVTNDNKTIITIRTTYNIWVMCIIYLITVVCLIAIVIVTINNNKINNNKANI